MVIDAIVTDESELVVVRGKEAGLLGLAALVVTVGTCWVEFRV